jgi:hypothetical protein
MRIGLITLMWMAAALPAGAQPAPAAAPPASRDPIGDILNRNVPPPKDEDEPDTAGQPRTAQEPDLEAIASPQAAPRAGPQTGPQLPFTQGPRQERSAPVRVEETGKTPDSPLTVRDMAYDARIRSSFSSAQSFQGPLEGGWTLADTYGDRYVLQIVDRRDRLEAVWRDLRRPGSITGSGLVDTIQRAGGDLTLKFTETQTPDLTLTLREQADGRWTGRLVRGDTAFPVTLRRTSP